MTNRNTDLRGIVEKLGRLDIRGVSIDSRNIREGELFVALKGDRFDGHDFVPDAIRKGAWGALVERSMLEAQYEKLGSLKNILPVEDTLFALQEMSVMHRKKHPVPFIGITGSNGKTTTKEMTACIVKQKGQVLKNEGNLNNHIGVPLTLLKLEARHKTGIVEMGMSARGEIELLARLVLSDIAVITNIGPAHLEFLGSMEGVADAKGELLENLRPDGTAVLNADDRYFERLRKKFSGSILSFGIEKKADIAASDVRQENEHTDFSLVIRGARLPVRVRAVGRHNVYNALAAAGAATALGMPPESVQRGLEEFAPVAMRSEIKLVEGRTVLADYYNANPGSVQAALETLVALRPRARSIAVLGDMLELGEAGAEQHREIGRSAARLGVQAIITVGTLARYILDGAHDAGMPKNCLVAAASHREAAEQLRSRSANGDVVLIKGSRGMKMEKILEEF